MADWVRKSASPPLAWSGIGALGSSPMPWADYQFDCPGCGMVDRIRAVHRHIRSGKCPGLDGEGTRAVQTANNYLGGRIRAFRSSRRQPMRNRIAPSTFRPRIPAALDGRTRENKRLRSACHSISQQLPPDDRAHEDRRERSPSPSRSLPRRPSSSASNQGYPDDNLDTPGAGPSNTDHSRSPERLIGGDGHEEQEDGDEEIDENFWEYEEEDEEELAARGIADWEDGLTPLERLSQALTAEIAKNGGAQLTEDDMLLIRAFNYKVDTDISGLAFRKLRRAFPGLLDLPTENTIFSRATALSGTQGKRIHICPNICIAYTGAYEKLDRCPHCRAKRYKRDRRRRGKLRPRKTFQYIPIIPRLANLYHDPVTARLMRSRAERQVDPDVLSDIFDGSLYQRLRERRVVVQGEELDFNHFSLPTDVALGLSTDGFGPFRSRKQSCWPLLVFNYNMPKELRQRLENTLCIGVIPGPASPVEIDSFLEPFIDELEILARGVPAFDGETECAMSLHAYLVPSFGDMPAMAKLMRMKGHSGKCPCRACRIVGFPARDKSGHIHYYPPLSCPRGEDRDGPRNYDPLHLPLRDHDDFLRDAIHVEESRTNREQDKRGRDTGISGLTALAALLSVEFPASFPHDFMHVMFENVVQNLLNLWMRRGKFKEFGTGEEPWVLPKAVQTAIGQACARSGDTIPAAFGCRVPNLDTKRSEITAESILLFATLIGPAVLRDRFVDVAYYHHFLKLVELIKKCLAFTITRAAVQEVREGFAKWVQKFEELYYNKNPDLIRVCTLPLHALLHLADDIENVGPVWCYWAFPMERFCGALGRANKSRRYPFASLDRYVLQVAQLAQLKRLYGLADELNLEERRTNIIEGTTYPNHPGFVLTYPCRDVPIDVDYKQKVSQYISEVVGAHPGQVFKRLRNRRFVHWGKLQQVGEGDYGGGDRVRAHNVSPNEEPVLRDASYVKYDSIFDHWVWPTGRIRRIDGSMTAFGRVEQFVVINTDFLQELLSIAEDPDTFQAPLILAIITPVTRLKRVARSDLIEYKGEPSDKGPVEVIDIRDIDCLVGRLTTGDVLRRQYIVDRTTVVGRVDAMNETVDPE